MKAPFKSEVSSAARISYRDRFLSGLRSERGPVVFSEQGFAKLTMLELDANTDATEKEASNESSSEHAYMRRIKFILAMALQRDARYAHANRTFLFSLGANNKLREDFQAVAAAAQTVGDTV
jgi:hypothetical protein